MALFLFQKPSPANHSLTSLVRLPLTSMVPPTRMRMASKRESPFLGGGKASTDRNSRINKSRSPVTFLMRVVILDPSLLLLYKVLSCS